MRTKFLRKNTYNSLLLCRCRTQKNIEGVKFWQIGADEANGEEYFGESDDRSSGVARPFLMVGHTIFKRSYL